jgi:serine/threonine-protein kinase RsbW
MATEVVLKITGPTDHLRLVWQTGETLLDTLEFDEDPEGTRYNVLVALQEMVTNVLRHAYLLDEDKPVEVAFTVHDHVLTIALRDQGPAFDPLGHDTADLDAEESMPTEVGGHGIRIARLVMDRIEYARVDGWNTLTMCKSARSAAAAGTRAAP